MKNPYLDPEEAAYASQDQTDKALGYVLGQLQGLLLKKQTIHKQLEDTDSEDEMEALEWQLKLLRDEERSLHRIESGLQSRLRVP